MFPISLLSIAKNIDTYIKLCYIKVLLLLVHILMLDFKCIYKPIVKVVLFMCFIGGERVVESIADKIDEIRMLPLHQCIF